MPIVKPPKWNELVEYEKQFEKDWKHLKHDNFRQKFLDSIDDFLDNPMEKKFNNHGLKWDFEWFRSINITWDIRAIYTLYDNKYIFVKIWSHSHLYW